MATGYPRRLRTANSASQHLASEPACTGRCGSAAWSQDLAVSRNGHVAVLTDDNIVSIYSPQRARLARLLATGPSDWLVIADTGLFDGTPEALRRIGYSASGTAPS